MLIKTIEQLSKMKVSELKELAKLNNLKGYSSLNKSKLVSFIKDNINEFGHPIMYVFNDQLHMYSITTLDYTNLSIKDMVSLLKEHVADKMFSDQAMNEKEVKALFRAGFRVRGQETLSERETLELHSKLGSIHMVANTTIHNLIEVVEVEPETMEQIELNNDTIKTEEQTNEQQEETIYTVGNKAFSTYNKSVQYYNDNDFDAELMIKSNEAINDNTNQNKIYTYAYTLRGFSIGCQPKGFISHDDNIGVHGVVSYDRQLTSKELSDYELIPYNLTDTLQTA